MKIKSTINLLTQRNYQLVTKTSLAILAYFKLSYIWQSVLQIFLRHTPYRSYIYSMVQIALRLLACPLMFDKRHNRKYIMYCKYYRHNVKGFNSNKFSKFIFSFSESSSKTTPVLVLKSSNSEIVISYVEIYICINSSFGIIQDCPQSSFLKNSLEINYIIHRKFLCIKTTVSPEI